MKIALVTSRHLSHRGGAERHVQELARGLARCGAEVELLAPGFAYGSLRVVERDGVIVHCFPSMVGPVHFAIAPGLRERLRLAAGGFDLVDVHSADPRLALAVIRSGVRRSVFTAQAPIGRLIGWPQVRTTAAVLAGVSQIVCPSSAERDALCERFPELWRRTSVVPIGVDTAAIHAATPIPHAGSVVLAVGRLERGRRIDRAIAAIASLAPGFRLVVVGDGPLLHRLRAHAADLRVSARVQFLGAVADLELYRWLRSARVVVALHDDHSSGIHVGEALAARAPLVASELPVHREAAARFDGARVKFVSPRGSPFEVADAIAELARGGTTSPTPAVDHGAPSQEAVLDRVWELYQGLINAGGADRGPGRGRAVGARRRRANDRRAHRAEVA
jgi:glycosyltransferase involved in cell wall biosynthesis